MTSPVPTSPANPDARIGELDVLRGFALLGVFVVHFVSSLYYAHPVEPAIREAWQADGLQFGLLMLCDLLFYDKAVTLFTTLFGVGFWIQMTRLEQRGDDHGAIYLRRLAVLLAIGAINKFLIFPGDVLLDYALFGFVLYVVRGLPAPHMLALGALLVVVLSPFAYFIVDVPWVDEAQHEAALDAAMLSTSYWHWVSRLAAWHWTEHVVSLTLIAWSLFVLGRFLLGAWIAREQLIERARANPRLAGRLALICLGAGYALEAIAFASWEDYLDLHVFFDFALHAIAMPGIAFGYACGIVCLYQGRSGTWLRAVFAPVGRMALTAYVAHGFVLLVFGQPFGFYLRPMIGPAAGWIVALSVFLSLTLFCRSWLAAFRFGPLEWLWRSLTYGTLQPLRRSVPVV